MTRSTIRAALVALATVCTAAAARNAEAQGTAQFVVNPRLADKGALVWKSRSCAGCHTMGHGRLTAPDLKAVTARRSASWLRDWLKNPGRMARTDETAKRLVSQAGTIMTDFHLSDDEIDALLHFLARANQSS